MSSALARKSSSEPKSAGEASADTAVRYCAGNAALLDRGIDAAVLDRGIDAAVLDRGIDAAVMV